MAFVILSVVTDDARSAVGLFTQSTLLCSRTMSGRRNAVCCVPAMTLTLKDVRRVASEVARQENPSLEVISATSSGGESGYAEVMLTFQGCRAEPCRVMIGVSRNASEAELRRAVAERLRAHAAEHQPVARQ